MSLQAASLEVLEKINVPPFLTRALAQVLDFEFPVRMQHLATKQDIGEMRTEMSEMKHQLRAEIQQTRHEIQKTRNDLELCMERSKNDLYSALSGVSRQMYLAILGQMAVLLGVMYFFLTYLR